MSNYALVVARHEARVALRNAEKLIQEEVLIVEPSDDP